MVQLTLDEMRVLGVLIEKATTTPEQYPLSLNAMVNGANQKSNRDPMMAKTEDQVFAAVEGLRQKSLAVRVDTVGSRVHKYKHVAGELLHARAGELAVLAELLLRGPQTIGELRTRAARMAPMESPDAAQEAIRGLMDRAEPLVKEIPPRAGSRAVRYLQLLCADGLVEEESAAVGEVSVPGSATLSERIALLETEVAELKEKLQRVMSGLGMG